MWDAIFHQNRYSVVLFKNVTRAIIASKAFKESVAALPSWLLPRVARNMRDTLAFNNGSRIWFKGFSPYALRGLSLNNLAISNQLNDDEMQEAWYTGAPCIVTKADGKLITFE